MTIQNERIHEAFRNYLNTTRLRRDGRSGTVAGAGAWRDRPKMTDALAALDVVIADYRAARLTSLDTRYLGQRFWRAVHQRVLDGVALGEWNYAHEYPDNDLACRQVGEWLVANRHLVDQAPVVAEQNTEALDDGRDIRVGAEPGWVFHRTTGDIVWAQGFSRDGLAFDAYPSSAGVFGQRLGTGAARSEDYAWLRVGDPLIPQEPSSYGLRLSIRSNWRVRSLAATGQPDGIRVSGDDADGGVRHGYAAASALGVDVGAALGRASEAPVDTETGEHVRVIDGVEWVRKATVDSDMETLTRTLHAAADSNGLCAVYDRTVIQVDEATEFLKMGAVRGRYRAVITETYTITREIDVPNEHRSDAHARATAEVFERLRAEAIPGATNVRRSAVTVDRVTRQS